VTNSARELLPPGSPIRNYSTYRGVWCQNKDIIASIMLCLHCVQKYSCA